MGIACFALFISLFYAIGFGLLGYGLWSARRSMQAGAWPTASATFTTLQVCEKTDSEGTTYEVKVQYAYTVDGVAYEGARLAFGYGGSSEQEAHEIYRKLKEAKTVAVRYDPLNPSVSCLLFGLHRSIRFLLAFAVIWLVFLIGFTLVFWFSRHEYGVLVEHLLVQ